MDAASILERANSHAVPVVEILDINDLGLDFQVITARDETGQQWVLRIPRREDAARKITAEARILNFLKGRVPFAVPDWKVATHELVAYPRLNDPTAVQVDAETREVRWTIPLDSAVFMESVGFGLAALHALSTDEAAVVGIRCLTPAQARQSCAADIDQVTQSFTVAPSIRNRWQAWLQHDELWPDFSVMVHGDLHATHILVTPDERVSGVIDWTEAEVSDPTIDFIFHLHAFGETGLQQMLDAYERAGGKLWPTVREQITERLAAFPIKYALFALQSGEQVHLDAVRQQLNPEA